MTAELVFSLLFLHLLTHTAAPLLRFNIFQLIPLSSAAFPMTPPHASISRTSIPFPIPPILGLQDISPIFCMFDVYNIVFAPALAAADAASVPA